MRAVWIFPWALSASLAAAAVPAPEATIPLSLYLGKMTALPAMVNGRSGSYFFDTGGGVTIISPATAAAGGCAPWGNVAIYQMNGNRIDAPHCENVSVTTPIGTYQVGTAVVFDVHTLLPKDAPPVEGLIALDLFAGKVLTLESKAQRLVLESPASLKERLKNAYEVPTRVVRDGQGLALTYDIGVRTSKGLAWMEIDSGNISGTMMVSTWVAPLFGLDPASREIQDVKGELMPGIALPAKARVLPNMIMDGLIGADFLAHWNLTIDQKNARIWLSPAE